MTSPTAFPLSWPIGWRRMQPGQRAVAKFGRTDRSGSYPRLRDLSISEAVRRVLDELRRFGVLDGDAIISTNVPVRLDGLPRSDARRPDDPGVAVYWRMPNSATTQCMAVDRYDDVAGNLAALAATLEAMRAIERHGGAAILERAFYGFNALPPPAQPPAARSWRHVLADGLRMTPESISTLAVARQCYRAQAAKHHPDRGGSAERMAEVNRAWSEAEAALS